MQECNFYKATEFIPERWMEDEESNYKPCRRNLVNAFGFGPRTCPGQRDATSKIEILYAKVVKKGNSLMKNRKRCIFHRAYLLHHLQMFRKYWIQFTGTPEMYDDWLMSLLDRKLPMKLTRYDH